MKKIIAITLLACTLVTTHAHAGYIANVVVLKITSSGDAFTADNGTQYPARPCSMVLINSQWFALPQANPDYDTAMKILLWSRINEEPISFFFHETGGTPTVIPECGNAVGISRVDY